LDSLAHSGVFKGSRVGGGVLSQSNENGQFKCILKYFYLQTLYQL